MALIAEDGTGKSDAESYNSVAEVSAFLAKTGEDAGWLALAGDTVREQVARKATRALDTEWTHRGAKKSSTQALEWPRAYAYDDDGYAYSSVALPQRLKEAHAQLCGVAAGSGGTPADIQPDQTEPGDVQAESISVGPIALSTTFAGGRSASAYYRKVQGLLSELTESGMLMERA